MYYFPIGCHRYVSECNATDSTVVSYGLDLIKDKHGTVTQIIEYRGHSLIKTCYSHQDFFIAQKLVMFTEW